jgi:hypothetical protein
MNIEDVGGEIMEGKYFLLTGHKDGKLKVWSIPEYELVCKFDVTTEVNNLLKFI